MHCDTQRTAPTRRGRRSGLVVVSSVFVVLVAACGSSSSKTAATTAAAATATPAPAATAGGGTIATAATSATSAVTGATTAATGGAPATGTPYKVFEIADSAATQYPEIKAAADAAITTINAAGGINGHPITIEVCDTNRDANQAATCARKAVSDTAVIAVVGRVTQ